MPSPVVHKKPRLLCENPGQGRGEGRWENGGPPGGKRGLEERVGGQRSSPRDVPPSVSALGQHLDSALFHQGLGRRRHPHGVLRVS